MQILVILGPPRSGLNLLSDCLSLLGMTNLANAHVREANTASQINSLLLQDLNRLPTMVGSLPADWLQSMAAKKARARIQTLIDTIPDDKTPLVIAEATLCRVLPLWLSSFRDADIEPRFIHLIRHPWECASSLARTEGIDLFQGHMLWLASHRDALTATTCHAHTGINFDQLLANPVHTLATAAKSLAIDYPLSLRTAYPKVINFVRPDLKHHHIGHAQEGERKQFAMLYRIYDVLRTDQACPESQLAHNQPAHTRQPQTSLFRCRAGLGLGLSNDEHKESSNTELIDLLFEAIAAQEHQPRKIELHSQPATTPQAETSLMAEFYLPQIQGDYRTKKYPFAANEWQQIMVPLPRPDLLQTQSLRFSPMNCQGTVLISALNLINLATEAVLWQVKTPRDFDSLELSGTVLRLPDPDNLVLLITGNNALVGLPNMEMPLDCPVGLELWMRTPGMQTNLLEVDYVQAVLKSYLEKPKPNLLEIYSNRSEARLNEDSCIDAIFKNNTQSDQDENFQILLEFGHKKLAKNDKLGALHFYSQAGKLGTDDLKNLFLLGQAYGTLGQTEQAFEAYVDLLTRLLPIDIKISSDLKKTLRNYHKQSTSKEHGHQLLIEYINNNLEFISRDIDRKLTLIEIGSTREDVPGQGSTRKLAQLCHEKGLHFITVDMDPRNTKYARYTISEIDDSFRAITAKGEDFLKEYNDPIDFVFLDAYDFDHGKHSEERQQRYERYIGARINDDECHQMHLECAQHLKSKLSPRGAICIDDTWYVDGQWRAKGTKAVPYLLKNGYEVVLSANKSVLLVRL